MSTEFRSALYAIPTRPCSREASSTTGDHGMTTITRDQMQPGQIVLQDDLFGGAA